MSTEKGSVRTYSDMSSSAIASRLENADSARRACIGFMERRKLISPVQTLVWMHVKTARFFGLPISDSRWYWPGR